MKEKIRTTTEIAKKKKYKIDYKKLGILVGGVILLIGIIGGGIWFFRLKLEEGVDEIKTYDLLVQLKDQKSANLEEDAKNSAKKGKNTKNTLCIFRWSTYL